MPRVEVSLAAAEDLDRLIGTLSLPSDTRERVRKSLRPLARFPQLGPELGGRWKEFRFILGPWRWLVIVYIQLPAEDRVVVVTMHDARMGHSPTADRSV